MTVYIAGAGLAGLACALSTARAGRRVVMLESSGVAGGRCRSFEDDRLGILDNGNHLVLGSNRAVFDFLREIGSDGLEPAEPGFPFFDLRDGRFWVLRPNAGPLPWWILAAGRRVPGTNARDYLPALRLLFADRTKTVAQSVPAGGFATEALWTPLTLAMLNTRVDEASARSLGRALRLSLMRGRAASRPYIAANGLGACFIEPALKTLAQRGVEIRFHDRVERLMFAEGMVSSLDTEAGPISLAPGDSLVLALPPTETHRLMPSLPVPSLSSAIVNVAYRLDSRADLPGNAAFMGLIGGVAQWLFVRGAIVTATVSAADGLVAQPKQDIAAMIWRDVARVFGLSTPLPAFRVVKERGATFRQTPAQVRLRPPTVTAWRNLFLAGDWTDTRLPATLEGAIRSGRKAASSLLG